MFEAKSFVYQKIVTLFTTMVIVVGLTGICKSSFVMV